MDDGAPVDWRGFPHAANTVKTSGKLPYFKDSICPLFNAQGREMVDSKEKRQFQDTSEIDISLKDHY